MSSKWLWFFAAALSPMFFWGLLATLSRRRPVVLRQAYRWMTAVCWILWLTAVALMSVGVLTNSTKSFSPYFRSGWLVWLLYAGLMIVKNWMGRRVDPEAYAEKPDGWWPTAKTNNSKHT